MAERKRRTRRLPESKERAALLLAEGKGVTAVADAVGVTRKTIWSWRRHDPDFIALLGEIKADGAEQVRARINYHAPKIVDRLLRLMDDPDTPPATVATVGLGLAKHLLPSADGELQAAASSALSEDELRRRLQLALGAPPPSVRVRVEDAPEDEDELEDEAQAVRALPRHTEAPGAPDEDV